MHVCVNCGYLVQRLSIKVAILCEEEGPLPLGSQPSLLTVRRKNTHSTHHTTPTCVMIGREEKDGREGVEGRERRSEGRMIKGETGR